MQPIRAQHSPPYGYQHLFRQQKGVRMAKQGMGRRQFLDLLLRGTAAATMAVSGLDCTAQKQDSMHDSHDISDVVGQKQSEQAYTADKEVNHLTHLLVDWAESYNASAAQDPNTGKTVQEKL